jgi:hypothetical protein
VSLPLILAGAAGFVVVATIVLAAVLGGGGIMSLAQRLGLCAVAAGIVGAGVGRAAQAPVGWFDALFVGGLAVYLAASYGPAIRRRADAADGREDGRVRWGRG